MQDTGHDAQQVLGGRGGQVGVTGGAESPTGAQSGWSEGPGRGVSLVAQWLRIRLPMQGTRVQEDPTCHGATKPVHHNY